MTAGYFGMPMPGAPENGKRRHESSSSGDSECSDNFKRLRIGGANPWCVLAPEISCPSLYVCSHAACARVARSSEHSPMSQPPHSSMPHPGLARSWASAQAHQPQQQHIGFPAAHHSQPQPPSGFAPPAPHGFGAFGGAMPPGGGGVMPPPPTTFCAAAAAAAMAPSLNAHASYPQPPMHPQYAPPPPPPPQYAPPETAHSSPASSSAFTPPPTTWDVRARRMEFPSAASDGPGHYTNINAMLGALHNERVNAGVRQRWAEADDDDDDEDL